MGRSDFWKESNVYELYGLDLMLDEDLQLWYIECNPNPLLDGVKPQFIEKMLVDFFEIQFAFYKSRMQRVMKVLEKMMTASEKNNNGEKIDYSFWRKEYQAASKNRLEPDYQISKDNTWLPIIDENLSGANGYYGHLSDECLSVDVDK